METNERSLGASYPKIHDLRGFGLTWRSLGGAGESREGGRKEGGREGQSIGKQEVKKVGIRPLIIQRKSEPN